MQRQRAEHDPGLVQELVPGRVFDGIDAIEQAVTVRSKDAPR